MTGRCCRGQTICKSCLDNWLVTSGANRCPVCSKKVARDSNTHPNYHIEREVSGLHIYCTNKEKGCEWQGELNNINNHLGNSDGCQFEEVKCSNECGKMIERRYLTNHVETECPRRKVNCQYCHDTVEHQFIDAAGHGDGKGTYLSVFLHLMKGPQDDKLTWPLRGKFEIKLLNQISDSEHHSKTVNYHYTDDEDIVSRVTKGDRATCGWGHHIFISNEDLHKTT